MDALRSHLIKHDMIIVAKRKFESTSFLLFCTGLCIILLLSLWSVLKIDRVVRVDGRIIPTGHSRPIQHLEGGIVSSIHVAEGTAVKKGDILLEIDPTMAGSNLNENKIKLTGLKLRVARLKAEVDGKTTLILPDDLTKHQAAEDELSLFKARKGKLESETKVHTETVKQYRASLQETEKQSESLEAEIVIAHKRVQMLQAMTARKAASQMDLLDAQERESRLITQKQEAQNAKPKIRAALATEQARIESAIAEFRTNAQNDLVAAVSEIERLSQMLLTATDRVERTEVKAPIDGIINRLSVLSAGSVVKPGENIIEITPMSEGVLIEAQVPPQDRGELKPGIAAKIRITAYDSASMGSLSGVLDDISADTIPNSRGDSFYRAKIRIGNLPESYALFPIVPGMTISGDLVLGQRTVLEYLLSPLTKFTRNMFRTSR